MSLIYNIYRNTIRDNLSVIQSILPTKTEIIWVVKSCVYGLGFEVLKGLLATTKHFAVETPKAALDVSKYLTDDCAITILYPFDLDYHSLLLKKLIQRGNVIPTVSSLNGLEKFIYISQSNNYDSSIHLLINIGGGRFGINGEDINKAVSLANQSNINIHSIYAHPSSSTSKSLSHLKKEYFQFKTLVSDFIGSIPVHFSDSASVLRGIGTELDYVRIGLLPIGALPLKVNDCAHFSQKLKVSFSLNTTMCNQMKVSIGDKIGYGKDSVMCDGYAAILDSGYSHGIPRNISQGGKVYSNGKYYSYLCPSWMEFSAVVSVNSFYPSLDFEIVGPNITPLDLSENIGGIPEEYFVNISHSVKRIYHG